LKKKTKLGSVRITKLVREISEEKKLENALIQRNAFLSSTLESIFGGILVVDRQGKVTSYNKKFAEMWNIPTFIVEKREDKLLLDYVFKQLKDPDSFLKKVRYLYKKPLEESHDFLEFKDGRIFERYSHPQILCNEVVGRVWSFVDITERKLIEERLRLANERLTLAQSSAGVGIWDWDIVSEAMDWSKELFVLFGLDPQETKATFDSWRSVVHPEDLQEAERRITFAVHNHTLLNSEYRIILPTREIRWINTLGNTTYDVEGKPRRMSGICIDITIRKQAEEVVKRDKRTLEHLVYERTRELLKIQDELLQVRHLSNIGTLAATIAHELRNPLAAIGMAISNIKRKTNEIGLLSGHIQTIEKKVLDSDRIINNLLSYSQIKSPHFENVDIFKVLEECLGSRYWSVKKNIRIKKDLSPIDGILIEADPLQIKEVFYNILNNAYDAVLEKEAKIEIACANLKDNISICITDNGVGIPEKDLGRIFDPFYTTKAKGTGLGLAVCQQILNLHRGTIDIKSKLDKGTSVTITLPKKA